MTMESGEADVIGAAEVLISRFRNENNAGRGDPLWPLIENLERRINEARATREPDASGEERKEGICDLCGTDYPCWSADSDMWNAAIRLPDGSDRWPFLCPTCFMAKAEEAGVETLFRVTRYDDPE